MRVHCVELKEHPLLSEEPRWTSDYVFFNKARKVCSVCRCIVFVVYKLVSMYVITIRYHVDAFVCVDWNNVL